MNIKQNLVATGKYGIKCPYAMIPQYITIHNTANDASAANEIAYMIRNNSTTSFHVAVDDKEAVQGVPFDRNAWHCGNDTGNLKSIAIEICYSKSGGDKFNKAYANAIELTAQLMKQFNIPASNIMYHKSWNGKKCPHRLLEMGVTLETYREKARAKYNALYNNKSNVLYTVQIGAYAQRENAEKQLKKAQQAGFTAFIDVVTQ
jgi:N-acetylmuramoyl-L-alanine amidase CwlA